MGKGLKLVITGIAGVAIAALQIGIQNSIDIASDRSDRELEEAKAKADTKTDNA